MSEAKNKVVIERISMSSEYAKEGCETIATPQLSKLLDDGWRIKEFHKEELLIEKYTRTASFVITALLEKI